MNYLIKGLSDCGRSEISYVELKISTSCQANVSKKSFLIFGGGASAGDDGATAEVGFCMDASMLGASINDGPDAPAIAIGIMSSSNNPEIKFLLT